MKKLILFIVVSTALVSCKATKYSTADCYKTHYKPIKKDKHKHPQCDAYN
jgi:hypothetical protein